MHTAQAARGLGLGRAKLDHLLAVARERGFRRGSAWETGTMLAFASARALYASTGFAPCGPFGDYSFSPDSTSMPLLLDGAGPGRA